MARKLPPLNSLRVFEAAARHLSFTKAADELCVTQAAVSHQIKLLETYLGTSLFNRLTRNLQLSPAGQALQPVLKTSLDAIAERISTLQVDPTNVQLKLRIGPSFASKWLSPRLMNFWERYPDISLSLQHSNKPVDFASEAVDIAITFGRGKWAGIKSYPIMNLDYFPVASPEFLTNRPPITTPEDMAKYYLLHDTNHDAWTAWFRHVGAEGITLKSGYIFDDTNVLIQGALDGQGFALCSTAFVADHIANGNLVKVFDQTIETDLAYHLCCPARHFDRPGVSEFRDWILGQVG